MTIVSRQCVAEAVARALLDAPEAGEEAAIETVAFLLGLPPEAIREALSPIEEPTC